MADSVTNPSGDSVSKVPRDPAAADKAAQDESVPAAKQSGVADDKTARGPEGGSGEDGEPLATTPRLPRFPTLPM